MSYLRDGNIIWRNQENSCSLAIIQIHCIFKSAILLGAMIVILLYIRKEIWQNCNSTFSGVL